MNCKGCEYPLWNLAARVCPECGRPFAPSEFEFVANSVKFCCPGCTQDYYGTGMHGHLVPPEFDCVRCGRRLRMDEMVLLPTEGVREEQTEADSMPWLRRAKAGHVRAWASTLWRSLVDPVRLSRTMPGEGGTLQAMFFALVSVFLFSIMLVAAFVGIMVLASAGAGARGVATQAAMAMGSVLAGLVAVAFLLLPLWGLLAHGIMRIGGATAQTMGASVRAACYCGGAGMVFMAVPCVGTYTVWIGVLWAAVSLMLMLRTLHGSGWTRAVFAAFTPPLALIAALVGWIAWLVADGMAMARQAQASAAAAPAMGPARIGRVLADARAATHGAWPAHGLRLIADGRLPWYELAPRSAGISMLDSWQVMSPEQQEEAAAAAERAMPADAIAHRLGKAVFTYHGLKDGMDGDLWVAVIERPGSVVMDAITLNGRVLPVPTTAEALAAQNALRAAEGLAPLPDPAAVTEGAPAIGK